MATPEDPQIVGLILTGPRGKGFGSEASDFDVLLVVRPESVENYRADAIGHALTVIFALEGRHRPYYGYLGRELETRPLAAFPLPADDLLALIDTIVTSADAAAQQRLLAFVDSLGRRAGCDAVFDEWGDRYMWMQ